MSGSYSSSFFNCRETSLQFSIEVVPIFFIFSYNLFNFLKKFSFIFWLSCLSHVILVPRQGIKPTSPALQGRLLTTGPGKSQCVLRFYAQMAFHNVDGVHSVLPFIHLPVHMPPASGVGPGQASLLIFQRLIAELLPGPATD